MESLRTASEGLRFVAEQLRTDLARSWSRKPSAGPLSRVLKADYFSRGTTRSSTLPSSVSTSHFRIVASSMTTVTLRSSFRFPRGLPIFVTTQVPSSAPGFTSMARGCPFMISCTGFILAYEMREKARRNRELRGARNRASPSEGCIDFQTRHGLPTWAAFAEVRCIYVG